MAAASRTIKHVRSTRDGNVLIVTNRDDKEVEKLRKTIQEAGGDMEIKKAGTNERKEVIHINGLDALAKKEDVMVAIQENIGETESGKVVVSELRPKANNTLAATVTLLKGSISKQWTAKSWNGEL